MAAAVAVAAAILSLPFSSSLLSIAALPARGELLPPRVRSCVSAVAADGPVAGERKEGRKVTSSVANGR